MPTCWLRATFFLSPSPSLPSAARSTAKANTRTSWQEFLIVHKPCPESVCGFPDGLLLLPMNNPRSTPMTTEQEPLGSGFGAQTTGEEALGDRDLRGKVALVTGGHSGIGPETTRVQIGRASCRERVGAWVVTRGR